MGPQRFDFLVMTLADKLSRRSLLAASLGAVALSAAALTEAVVSKRKRKAVKHRDEQTHHKQRQNDRNHRHRAQKSGRRTVAAAKSSLITWPFKLGNGAKWGIVSGYEQGDHANDSLYGLDFALCTGTINPATQTCSAFDLQQTHGAKVYSPVNGMIAWGDNGCAGLAITVDGTSDHRVVLIHVDKDPSLPGSDWKGLAGWRDREGNPYRFKQGDLLGTVSAIHCHEGTVGDHIHMHLYRYSGTDTRLGPEAFTGAWAIGGCQYPEDGSHQGQIVPCGSVSKPKITAGPTVVSQPTSAMVTWTTDQNSDSSVEYGLTKNGYDQHAADLSLTTSHTVDLAGLSPETTYHYQVQSANAAGLVASQDKAFTTPPCPAGTKLCGGQCRQLGTVADCRDCDDGCEDRPCNIATCNPDLGCGYVPLSGDACQVDGVDGTCVNGTCVTDPCAGADCSVLSNSCNDGVCENGQCVARPKLDGTSCGTNGETCVNGTCPPGRNYTFVTTWGSYGTGDGQFGTPWGMAVDAAGYVYVADSANHRIQKFAGDGTFVTKWGSEGTGNGQFRFPTGVAVDAAGNVYVADRDNNRIQKFTENGVFLLRWGSFGTANIQFTALWAVAVGEAGAVYVLDAGSREVKKFTGEGTFLAKWGSEGTGDAQFLAPRGVAVDAVGNVYVVDASSHEVKKFTGDGAFLAKWGSEGTDDGQFGFSEGLAVDAWGNQFITDRENHRVHKFAADGTFLTKWGSEGTGDGQFGSPTGVAVDTAGNVYVAERIYSFRVQKFAPVAASQVTAARAAGEARPQRERQSERRKGKLARHERDHTRRGNADRRNHKRRR